LVFNDKGEHQKNLLKMFAIHFHTVWTHLFTLGPEVIYTTSDCDLRSQKPSGIRAIQCLAERSPRKTTDSREWDGMEKASFPLIPSRASPLPEAASIDNIAPNTSVPLRHTQCRSRRSKVETFLDEAI